MWQLVSSTETPRKSDYEAWPFSPSFSDRTRILLSHQWRCLQHLQLFLLSQVEHSRFLPSKQSPFNPLPKKTPSTVVCMAPEKKANLIRSAAMNYLLDLGVQWGSAPAVKVLEMQLLNCCILRSSLVLGPLRRDTWHSGGRSN